jgi:hypothetical protein
VVAARRNEACELREFFSGDHDEHPQGIGVLNTAVDSWESSMIDLDRTEILFSLILLAIMLSIGFMAEVSRWFAKVIDEYRDVKRLIGQLKARIRPGSVVRAVRAGGSETADVIFRSRREIPHKTGHCTPSVDQVRRQKLKIWYFVVIFVIIVARWLVFR